MNQVLNAQVSEQLQVAPYERNERNERSEQRQGYRNGYKPRHLTTRVGALLMEQDEVWTTGKRYFDMTAYWLWRERQPQQAALFQEAPMLQPA